MDHPLVWICAVLVLALIVAGGLLRSQRKTITEQAARIAKMDGDAAVCVGGSRRSRA